MKPHISPEDDESRRTVHSVSTVNARQGSLRFLSRQTLLLSFYPSACDFVHHLHHFLFSCAVKDLSGKSHEVVALKECSGP